MTTKKNAPSAELTTIDNANTTPIFAGLQPIANELDLLDDKDTGEMLDASAEYLNFEEGQVISAIAYGITEIAGYTEGTTSEAVQLYAKDEEGNAKAYINADKVIVSTCKRLLSAANAKGTDAVRIKIHYTGKVKGANGTYKNFKIFTL